MSPSFLTPLDLEFIDGHLWSLTAPLEYHLGAVDGPEYVQVPTGFLTDFTSIPRGLWNLLPPTGRYGKAAVVHDFLYQDRVIRSGTLVFRLCDRGEADKIFLEAMGVLGVGWLTRHTIYAGVRLGGWLPWNRYRRSDKN